VDSLQQISRFNVSSCFRTIYMDPATNSDNPAKAITAKVLSSPFIRRCNSVSCYLSMPTGEVDTSSLVSEFLSAGKFDLVKLIPFCMLLAIMKAKLFSFQRYLVIEWSSSRSMETMTCNRSPAAHGVLRSLVQNGKAKSARMVCITMKCNESCLIALQFLTKAPKS
jgi:hypothetical protein